MFNKFSKNKKLFSFLLSLVLALGVLVTPIHDAAFAEDTENVTEIAIVHTNDTHSRIKEGIGFAKIPTIVQGLKNEGKEVLLLDAGDTLHGLPIATISRGKSIVDVMNLAGYDAMVPGNHDFNYGYERLLELKGMANFEILASNVVKENGQRDFKPYIVKELDGIKVGVFGLATPETKYKSSPKNTEGVNFEAPVDAGKRIVKKLKEEEKVDIVIALSHLGMDQETNEKERSTTVAREVEGIDLLIDGHSHTTLTDGTPINDTLIVQTGSHTNNVGVVNIKIQDGNIKERTGKLITTEEAGSIEGNQEIETLIEEIEEKNEEITSEVIGEAKVRLDGERENVRAGETNLANLITDIMLEAGEADVTITNGGGIRASIEAGEITMGDVIAVLPFGNYLVVKEVKGSDILAALEHGTASYPEPAGGFSQVAGMTYKLDTTEEVGKRVHSVKVNGKPLDLNKSYKVATNDFMASGGDGYTMLGGGNLIAQYPGLDEIVADGIREMKVVEGVLDNRMTVETKGEDPIIEPEEPTEEDKEKANKVIDLIDKLPEKITLKDKETIEATRKAYDALTDEQKALVTNLAKLEEAEKALAKLEEDTEKPGEKPKTKPEVPKPGKPKGKGNLPKTGTAPWALTGLAGALMIAAGWRLKKK